MVLPTPETVSEAATASSTSCEPVKATWEECYDVEDGRVLIYQA